MIGGGIIGILFSSDVHYPNNPAADYAAAYQNHMENVNAMAKQAELEPDNLPLLKALAYSYFQAVIYAQYTAPGDMRELYDKAVNTYQAYLAIEQDENVMLEMAYVAYSSGDDALNELAEQTYQDVLSLNPASLEARIQYGLFLFDRKHDYAGSIGQLHTALEFAQEDAVKDQIQSYIDQIQSYIDLILSQPKPDHPEDAPEQETEITEATEEVEVEK